MQEFWRICHWGKMNEQSGTFAGPYDIDLPWPEQREMAFSHRVATHPTPMEEIDLRMWFLDRRPEAVCGARSLDALLSWFQGHLGPLADAGFMIRAYEVPDDRVRVSERSGQAVAIIGPEDLIIEGSIREVLV